MIKECLEYLRTCFEILKLMMSKETTSSIRNITYLCKVHIQMCALLSQQDMHVEAFEHAKYATKYSSMILDKTIKIAESMTSKPMGNSDTFFKALKKHYNENKGISQSYISEPPSAPPMIELLAQKVLPVLYEFRIRISDCNEKTVSSKAMTNTQYGGWKKHKVQLQPNKQPVHGRVNMKNLFGYCKVNEWSDNVSISSIMQITPLTFHDIPFTSTTEAELTRESLIEKITLILIAYFSVGIEKCFIAQNDEVNKKQYEEQSEYWHTKVLELAYYFLPPNCPFLIHIFSIYQKNYAVTQNPIVLYSNLLQ